MYVFGNSTFSIFTACCFAKSLDNGGLKKYYIVVVNDSKERNRTAALTCLKKVVEKAEEINVAKYDKIIVWSDGCSAQFRFHFVYRLLKQDFFDHVELTWNYNEKGNGKSHDSPFEFHQAILKVVPSIKSVYLPDTDVLNEPENIEQESKKIPETLQVHHVERFEVKWVYGLKVFLPNRG